jgi:acetylornithine deacetylase/succinyl-diaminopimelate desuccinylase-like protein
VLIPGFYDDVAVPSVEERRIMNSAPWDDQARAKEIGVSRLFHEEGFTPRESSFLRPTFQVNGIIGGYTGPGFKTVIGNHAKAKISMRLVHNQNPDKIAALFEKAVRDRVGDMGTVKFQRFGAGLPFRADLENPYVKAGLKALEAGFGKPAVVLGMGGSIPIVAPLVEATGAPCVLMGFGLPGDNLHAPNEHFAIDCFLGGARSAAAYLHAVGAGVGAASGR